MKYRHIEREESKGGKNDGGKKREERFQPTTAYIMVVSLEDNGTENFLQLTDVFVVLMESNVFIIYACGHVWYVCKSPVVQIL